MSGLMIGYARVSTIGQDLTAQRDGLPAPVVESERVYVDHGLTGTSRLRPRLREALAACRGGDTLVVTKLDRLARSVPDARDIVEELIGRGVRLELGGSVHDPTDPDGRLLFNDLAMVAEADLIKATRPRGHGRGPRPPASSAGSSSPGPRGAAGRPAPHRQKSPSDLAELFGVERSTVYRALQRATTDTGAVGTARTAPAT